MLDPTDRLFFQTLASVCGDKPAVAEAAERALQSGHPDDLRAARQALDALPEADRLRVLQQLHHGMAGNLSAIWDQLPNGTGSGTAH